MKDTQQKFHRLLKEVKNYFSQASAKDIGYKPSEKKWSKKEILGHLIDSGMHNWQRFIEVQFMPKPYHIRPYRQDELVKANNYQMADIEDLLTCWLGINQRISQIIGHQTEETLKYAIILDDKKVSDLRFLIEDYVAHMGHHVKQIVSSE